MGTKYLEIFDLALVSIEDYKLNQLYESSSESFLEVMKGFLTKAIGLFDNCKQDLSNRNDIDNEFNFILSDVEKGILADWMGIVWIDKEINDARQITGMLQNKNEAHRASEANLLTSKLNRQIEMKEYVRNRMTRYGLRNSNWETWTNV